MKNNFKNPPKYRRIQLNNFLKEYVPLKKIPANRCDCTWKQLYWNMLSKNGRTFVVLWKHLKFINKIKKAPVKKNRKWEEEIKTGSSIKILISRSPSHVFATNLNNYDSFLQKKTFFLWQFLSNFSNKKNKFESIFLLEI